MKTLKIKVLGLALLMSMGAFAQDFHYGIKAGPNFAVQSEIGDIYNNSDVKIGLNAALFSNYQFSKNTSVQIELGYDQKGSKSEDVKMNLDYITVPVLVMYRFERSVNIPFEFHVNAGSYAAFLLNADEKNSVSEKIEVSEDFNKAEFGVLGGLGMKYPISNNNILFDLRIGIGLTELAKNNSDLRNKYIGVSVGYEF